MKLNPLVLACSVLITQVSWAQTAAPSTGTPTTAEAEQFVHDAEAKLEAAVIRAQRAEWIYENFITDDTEAATAQESEALLAISGELALQARRYNGVLMSEASKRKLAQMQLNLMLSDPAERAAYARIAASMSGSYGKAKYCPKKDDPKSCLALGELEHIMATSRDPALLKEVWLGWHSLSPSYKDDYAKYVALSNKGAVNMGYADTGALWRSNYEMTPKQFEFEMERLWQQVKPLYDSLYTYTRHQLQKTYGEKEVPSTGPIPAHLFGNMWSQTWDNLYPILKPEGLSSSYDLSEVLKERKVTPTQMAGYAERFYTSLGMEKLPETFWKRSLLSKPKDREVVCHASAWDIDARQDVRIKMCITPTAEDFTTIHHELGHVYYFLAYRDQDPMFHNGANDGFHEAIGDTIALSVTPEYLKKIGLRETLPTKDQEIGTLLNRALEKVAFLPFGYLVDKWRWEVYSGKVTPENYDKAWWELREQYQGISRPAPMEANGFDAGAKFHVASDTPYARYFLADILQFQFHRALCKEAGYVGPLNRCSIFENKQAGEKFQAMLKMGSSKPWPEALKTMTGSDRIDATAILDYFAPLKVWLDEQNALYEKSAKK
ncbi:M2 family metallopeptidase [Solimicrobium silvestre]|uniref:Angiotensin-converting enzyme n=1 Tax=Solimicrobium silvestre TaxID=2099400 RepID=A0A2S9H4X6_9BURK|nr:M2 family metallopeptidase [Solimicrobium silvestre]PRC95018.1 Angiotensin-converting enzyme [Solimicrobium silvestre]